MAQTLATPEELASVLQTDLDLATATLLLEMATGIVQAACGQLLIETDVTGELVDITCQTYWLELANKPVTAVASVELDGTAVTDWSLRKQKLWRAGGWLLSYSPPSQAEVTYTYGYPAGSQYLQLARSVTLSLAQAGYGNPGQVKGEAIDDYKVTFSDALARMELTEPMRTALVNAYGSPAVVTVSEVE
jgi:hypothetical protein